MGNEETGTHVEVRASCLCKNHVFTASIPSSSLPLEAWTCHCTSCRHVSGALYTHDTLWHGPLDEVTGAGLSLYQMTKSVALLFCGRCSSPMFWWERYDGKPEVLDVLVGALECDEKIDLVKTVRHAFVGDTVDGGAAPWLGTMGVGQEDIPVWEGRHEESHLIELKKFLSLNNDEKGPDEIPVICHCRGVDLILRRGDEDYAKMERKDLPFFVDPCDYKLLASFDGCNSCRKSFGINVMNWTFTLLKHLAFADGSPFPASTLELKDAVSSRANDERLGTLEFYSSSPDVQRYFCSRCSASVFYAVNDRPEMVDLSVGLLDAPNGARAESRLTWALGPPITWRQDAIGTWREGFVEALERSTEEWRLEAARDVIWRRADQARSV